MTGPLQKLFTFRSFFFFVCGVPFNLDHYLTLWVGGICDLTKQLPDFNRRLHWDTATGFGTGRRPFIWSQKQICSLSMFVITYCKKNWCAVWRHLQWTSQSGGSWIKAQPADSGQLQVMSTWLSGITQMYAKHSLFLCFLKLLLVLQSVIFRLPSSSRPKRGVIVSWYLYSLQSFHTVSGLSAQRGGIVSGLRGTCVHTLLVLVDVLTLSSVQWPFSESYPAPVKRKEKISDFDLRLNFLSLTRAMVIQLCATTCANNKVNLNLQHKSD